jgi:hypothetical protein
MKTFIAGNIEVMRKDYPDFNFKMSYEDIKNLDLGKYSEEGWRIPTSKEIRYIYKIVNCAAYNRSEWNSQKWSIGNFGDGNYWFLSMLPDSSESTEPLLLDFIGGAVEAWSKGQLRLVRNIGNIK